MLFFSTPKIYQPKQSLFMAQIIYTITDEAPALATRSFLPIVRSFVEPFGISIETKDISLAAQDFIFIFRLFIRKSIR